MRYHKHLLASLLFLFGTISCKKDFLDVPDKSVLLRQAYVVDLNTTQHYLNGIYLNIGRDFYGRVELTYPDIIADDVKPVAGWLQLSVHYAWGQRADDAKGYISDESLNMNHVWRLGYGIIRDCNFIIENVDKYRNENVNKADDIKGQAYALRALIHFVLTNVFAQSYNFTADASHTGVPYVITADWTDPVSRQTVAEVYTELIDDLGIAIQLLPNSSNKLAVTRNAAKALQSRIYLFKGDYLAAKNLAREVALSTPIMEGADYPSKLFTADETEALLQLSPSITGVDGGTYDALFAGAYYAFDLYAATNDIASLLREDANDARSNWIIENGGVWYIRKYPADGVPGYPSYSYYHTLIRSSEMYLTAAESYARLNNEDSARFYLDAIRLRANPSLGPITLTGAALLDAICKERRKELVFEGFRMFDLLRWKKGVKRGDAINQAAKELPYPSNKAIAPIPLSDVTILGMPQNTGY